MSDVSYSTVLTDEVTPVQRIVESPQYDSTNYSSFDSTTTEVRSLFPPVSWPSSADFLHDSDVCPRLDESTAFMARLNSLDSSVQSSDISREVTSFPIYIEEIFGNESDHSSSEEEETSCSEDSEEIGLDECESSACTESSGPSLYILPIKLVIKLPISGKKFTKLCFEEKLVISEFESPQKVENFKHVLGEDCKRTNVGSMLISIQQEENNAVIYSKSQFTFRNKEANSSILSFVDNMFQLVEEKRTESLRWGNKSLEKKLHVVKEGDTLTMFRTSIRKSCAKNRQKTMKLSSIGDLILDGGSLLLMRYFVEMKFIGDFEVWTMHIKGELCRSLYNVRKEQPIPIKNQVVAPVSIKKTIYRKNKPPSISETYFLPTGHILQHRWKNCKFFIHLDNDLLGFPPCRFAERLENRWNENLVLHSRFLDLKSHYQSEIKSYLEDNSEIKRIFADYLFNVLEKKPENILDFTVEYFRRLYYDGGIMDERKGGHEDGGSEENDEEETVDADDDIDESDAKTTDLRF